MTEEKPSPPTVADIHTYVVHMEKRQEQHWKIISNELLLDKHRMSEAFEMARKAQITSSAAFTMGFTASIIGLMAFYFGVLK